MESVVIFLLISCGFLLHLAALVGASLLFGIWLAEKWGMSDKSALIVVIGVLVLLLALTGIYLALMFGPMYKMHHRI